MSLLTHKRGMAAAMPRWRRPYREGAALLADDYNSTADIGSALMQARQYNDDNARKVAEFNRATNQFNATAANHAADENFGLNSLLYGRTKDYANARDAATTAASAANSAAR